MTLDKHLLDLQDEDRPLGHLDLLQLSGLSSEEVIDFKAAWAALSRARKQETLSRLIELSEENIDLEFNAIYRACLGDDDEEVREEATRGLWESDDRITIRPLISLLADDPSTKVRAAAAVSLGRFAEMAQDGKLLDRDSNRVREALLSVVDNKDEEVEVRRRAIEAVSCFDVAEIERIIQQAYQDDDPKLRQSAIYAMGRSSDSRWLPTVLQETDNETPEIRYEAANACGQLGDESTVPYLISLIKDEDVQVQLSSVHALGSIGGPLAKRALLQCLKLEDDALEEAAQAALENLEFDSDPMGLQFNQRDSPSRP